MSDQDERGAHRTEPETDAPPELITPRGGPSRPVLVVLTGPQLGERIPLRAPVVLGRDPDAELVLTDDSVDWHHARVEPRESQKEWAVVDLTGSGKTEVNGQRVGYRILKPDDQLILGHTVVRFEVHDPVELAYDQVVTERLFRDDLTGLPSRRKFDNDLRTTLGAARRMDRPLAVAIMDVDSLKPINDRYGHLAGAEIIAHVGRTIRAVLGDRCLACRLGGDEFGVAWLGEDREGGRAAVEALRQHIAQAPYDYDGQPLVVRLSAGVSQYPVDGATPTELLRSADQALYRAKAEGGDRVVTTTG